MTCPRQRKATALKRSFWQSCPLPCFKQEEVACSETTHGSRHLAADRPGMLIRLVKKRVRSPELSVQKSKATWKLVRVKGWRRSNKA